MRGNYNMSHGWVKLHRQILRNPIFQNDKLFRVFVYLLLSARHTDGEQLIGDTIVPLKSGQWATGRIAISRDTGLTQQNVRTALNKLEKLNILTIKPTTKFSVFSIVNWEKYQQDNQQVTNNQPTSNQQVTTNKNGNNDNNEKKATSRFKKPTEEDLISYFNEYCSTGNFEIKFGEHQRFYDFYESKNWYVGKNKMKDWKAAVRNWLSKHKKDPATPKQRPKAFGE